MTNPDTPLDPKDTTDPDAPFDPKEQMRAALDAKKAGHHMQAAGPEAKNSGGSTAGKSGGRREFRRKSGG